MIFAGSAAVIRRCVVCWLLFGVVLVALLYILTQLIFVT